VAVEILIGLLAGAVAGGCLAYQGKSHKSYGLGLFTKVGLVSSGLPFLRLGLQQDHGPTGLVFLGLGSLLFLLGGFLILDVALQTKELVGQRPWLSSLANRLAQTRSRIRFMTFIPPALVLLLINAYLIVGLKLTCQRLEPRWINCLLEEYRWLGLVKIQETSLQGLQEWRYQFSDIVLVAQSGQATLPSRPNTFFFEVEALDKFLASTEPALTLSSTPNWFIPIPLCLAAGLFFWAAFAVQEV
jgi:hypothetical protein